MNKFTCDSTDQNRIDQVNRLNDLLSCVDMSNLEIADEMGITESTLYRFRKGIHRVIAIGWSAFILFVEIYKIKNGITE